MFLRDRIAFVLYLRWSMKYHKSEVLDLFVTRWFACFIHRRGINTQHFMLLSRTSSTGGVEGLQIAFHLTVSSYISCSLPFSSAFLQLRLLETWNPAVDCCCFGSLHTHPPPPPLTSVISLFWWSLQTASSCITARNVGSILWTKDLSDDCLYWFCSRSFLNLVGTCPVGSNSLTLSALLSSPIRCGY
jgi:hypothetical protein